MQNSKNPLCTIRMKSEWMDIAHQYMMNAKCSQKSFWNCLGNSPVKTTPLSPQKMCQSFKFLSVYCRFFPNPQ